MGNLMKLVCNYDCSVCECEHTKCCETCSEDHDNFYPVQEFFDEIDCGGN